jgi:hypothetical protein
MRTVFAALALLLTSPALAAVPSAATSFVDPVIIGSWDGNSPFSGPQQCGPVSPGFEVRVLDAANVPVGGAVVTLRFLLSGARPHAAQNAGTLVDCPAAALTKRCDANGYVRFDPRIAGYDLGNNVDVVADGILLRQLPVVSPDLNGDGAMSLPDFILFSNDYLNPVPQPRTDYNYCLATRLPDYVWFTAQYIAGVNQPPALLCP